MKILRFILFIINIVLVLGLVLTTLAGVIVPSRSILPSLLAFGYVPMLAANLLMVLIWALMGRWELLLSVAAIAARWTMVPLLLQAGGTSKVPPLDEHPARVVLMSYNVHQFQGDGTSEVRADSIARGFIDLVRVEAPDVLCLQEYAAVRGVAVTDSLTTMGYNHYYGAHTSSSGSPYGTTVFSRFPITFVKRLDSEKVLVELMCEGRRMRVVCLHMDSYRFDNDDLEAVERMRHGDVKEYIRHSDSTAVSTDNNRRTMHKIKETILSHEEEWNKTLAPVVGECTMPMLVAGDMNDIPWSWLYHQMSRRLTDTFTECGTGFSTTYRIGSTDMPRTPLSFRIDMVFRNEGLRTLSYKRIKTHLSDHYPLLVAVEFEI